MMKPNLLRWISLMLCCALGLASSAIVNEQIPNGLILPSEMSADVLIPPIELSSHFDFEYPIYPPLNYVVISVPSDGEFYFGRQQLHSSEIGPVLLRSLSTVPNCQRVVYIKSAAQVKFATLNVVLTAARQSGADRIEFVLDKKKRPNRL